MVCSRGSILGYVPEVREIAGRGLTILHELTAVMEIKGATR